MAKILRCVLGLVKTVVLGVAIDGDAIVVSVRPHKRERLRCPVCGRRCDCHDHEPTRRWRAMDLARSKCYLEYRPARVRCPEHGVLVERVPWARRGSRFTRDFEDWVACLAVRCCMSAVSRIARVDWHSVGGVCRRVYDEIEAQRGAGRFDGLRRIGIDETSYKRGAPVPHRRRGPRPRMPRNTASEGQCAAASFCNAPLGSRTCSRRCHMPIVMPVSSLRR